MPNPDLRIESAGTSRDQIRRRALTRGRPAAVLSLALVATALGAVAPGCAGEEETEGLCTSTEQFFAEKVWAPTISTVCIGCHNSTGAAKDTSYVLAASSEAGYLETNLEILRQVAELEKGGKSLILLKPTGELAHEGGVVLEPGTQQYEDLARLVQMLKEGNDCETNKASFFAGVELAGPKVTLRKATLALAARLPTDDELAKVEAEGFDAFGAILDQLMTEEAFFDRIRENYNNLFLTDQYITNNQAVGLLESGDEDDPGYYNPAWYEGTEGDANLAQYYGVADPDDVEDFLRRRTVEAVAREPVELITHVVRNNRPFSEVLTANYMMVNPFSAKAWGAGLTFENDANPYEWQQFERPEVPLAGVLTSVVWLNRHPTTPTNRNRHRARMVYYDWLGSDILKTAERPLDPTKITDHNPTMNNSACTVCHAQLDPLAGAFLNYQGVEDNRGQAEYYPEFSWYQDMLPPGFGGDAIGFEDQKKGLPWLAQRVTRDGRFPLAVVYQAFRAFVGQEPMLPPVDQTDPAFTAEFEAYLGQYYALSEVADNFAKSNYNFKQIVKDLVMSPYFRALNASPNAIQQQVDKFGEIGTAHLLTPEELDRKIQSVIGVPWTQNGNSGTPHLLSQNRYRLLYGGINSDDVTTRIREPNGVMANVIERMGNELSCRIVPSEFAIPANQRRFFSGIETTFAPRDANGFEVSSAVSGIKETIRQLHYKILGEDLEANDPEIERTYQLFLTVWDQGYAAVRAEEEPEEVSWMCGANGNYLTGEAFDEDTRWKSRGDALYTKRAWMAVFSYLITDYTFIHE